VVVGLILLLRQRSRRRAIEAWRAQSRPALEDANLALGLLPASEQEIIDRDHWQSVRLRIEEAGRSLDTTAAVSPTEPGRLAARQAAEGLRGLMFALESGLLLRESPVAPTGDQLMQADAAARARRSEAQSALDQLDRLINPPPKP
jgi:hypothetical protein